MTDQVPPKGGKIPFITGVHWSVGINTPASLSQTEVLTVLGHGLQTLYGGLIEEGIPEHLAPVVEKLERAEE